VSFVLTVTMECFSSSFDDFGLGRVTTEGQRLKNKELNFEIIFSNATYNHFWDSRCELTLLTLGAYTGLINATNNTLKLNLMSYYICRNVLTAISLQLHGYI